MKDMAIVFFHREISTKSAIQDNLKQSQQPIQPSTVV